MRRKMIIKINYILLHYSIILLTDYVVNKTDFILINGRYFVLSIIYRKEEKQKKKKRENFKFLIIL